jgi:methanogenic corrinoid protein MtbC1
MFSIGSVSRETGIPTATLRKWEERYSFPKPNRHNGHTRSYSHEEIIYLHEIKKRIDQGERPSQLFGKNSVALTHLKSVVNQSSSQAAFINQAIEMLIAHEMKTLHTLLEKKLKKLGIFKFIVQVAKPLTIAVGDKWADGILDVFTEHCYSQQMYSLLHSTVKPKTDCAIMPRILLATLPGEKHTLGLAMMQALLFSENANCINLGAELPLLEFPKAATHYHANIVGVSFSIAFPQRSLLPAITQLRASLPSDVALWVGGSGAKRLVTVPSGIELLCSAAEVVAAFSAYKTKFTIHSQS